MKFFLNTLGSSEEFDVGMNGLPYIETPNNSTTVLKVVLHRQLEIE